MRKSKDLPPKLVENTYNYKAIIEFLLIKEKAFEHVKIMKHRGVLYRYLEYEDIGDPAEGDPQVDDLSLGHLVGDVPDVDHLQQSLRIMPHTHYPPLEAAF